VRLWYVLIWYGWIPLASSRGRHTDSQQVRCSHVPATKHVEAEVLHTEGSGLDVVPDRTS
jgi:hypothetical protein